MASDLEGIFESPSDKATTACSFSVRTPTIASELNPLRNAKEQVWAVQYAQESLLEAHIAKPRDALKDLLPNRVAGKLNILGTNKL